MGTHGRERQRGKEGQVPGDLRCDGDVGGRHWADLLHLLGFLQEQLFTDGLLLLLLILWSTNTHTHTYIYECMYGNHSHTHSRANFVSAIVQVMLISYTTSPRSGQYASRSRYATFVSSWAFARLSTAMARKTLRRVSGRSLSKENTTNTWQHKQLMLTTHSQCYRELVCFNSFQLVPNC